MLMANHCIKFPVSSGELITTYAADLRQVQDIYMQFKEHPAVYASMPPTACALVWCRGLMERISGPLSRLTGLSKGVLETQEAKETLLLADSLMKLLQEYTQEKYEEWASKVWEDLSGCNGALLQ